MKSDSISYHILSMKKLDTLYHMHKYDGAIVCIMPCHLCKPHHNSTVFVSWWYCLPKWLDM